MRTRALCAQNLSSLRTAMNPGTVQERGYWRPREVRISTLAAPTGLCISARSCAANAALPRDAGCQYGSTPRGCVTDGRDTCRLIARGQNERIQCSHQHPARGLVDDGLIAGSASMTPVRPSTSSAMMENPDGITTLGLLQPS